MVYLLSEVMFHDLPGDGFFMQDIVFWQAIGDAGKCGIIKCLNLRIILIGESGNFMRKKLIRRCKNRIFRSDCVDRTMWRLVFPLFIGKLRRAFVRRSFGVTENSEIIRPHPLDRQTFFI